MNTHERNDELNLNDPRFDQLMDLAREGNDEAIADLWREFGYDYPTGKFSKDRLGVDGDDWIDPSVDGGAA